MKRLILASQSPRRKSLLAQFGLDFDIQIANVDETRLENESPEKMALRLAELKALSIYTATKDQYSVRVLGSDTTVVLGDTELGKPKNKHQAVAMLQQLSGKSHFVFSAVALVDDNAIRRLLSKTKVSFKELSPELIESYCNTDDPYDKAGAYGIQGPAGKFIDAIEGSYSGVMGLPLWHTHQLLFF